MTDLYEILGLHDDANTGLIQGRYRELVKQHHPDLYRNAEASVRQEAEERMCDLNRAYSVLKDRQSRQEYLRRRAFTERRSSSSDNSASSSLSDHDAYHYRRPSTPWTASSGPSPAEEPVRCGHCQACGGVFSGYGAECATCRDEYNSHASVSGKPPLVVIGSLVIICRAVQLSSQKPDVVDPTLREIRLACYHPH